MATKSLHRATKAHSRNRSAAARGNGNFRAEAGASEGEGTCAPVDRTDNRLRAYVASVCPLPVAYPNDDRARQHRGRSLIERLAMSAHGIGLPTLQLDPEQVADVLAFMSAQQPIDAKKWWFDPPAAPSHLVGFYLVLQALEESLRQLEPAILSAALAALDQVIALTPPERNQFVRAFKRRLRNVHAREGVRS